MLRLFFDDTSNRGSDSGKSQDYNPLTPDETDDQIYSDDIAPSYEGSNYQGGSDGGSSSDQSTQDRRKSLIDKAKAYRDQQSGKDSDKEQGSGKDSDGKKPGKDSKSKNPNPKYNKDALEKAKQNKSRREKPKGDTGKKDGASSSPSSSSAKKGASGVAGGASAKGKMGKSGGKGGLIDPEAVKSSINKLKQGDWKGGAKEGLQTLEKAGLDKAMMACVDGLIPSFGLTLILMNIIWIVAFVTGVKLPIWERLLTLLLDLLLAAIIIFIFLLIFGLIYGYCEAVGLNQGGVIAAIASPLAAVYDWVSGNQFGTLFVDVCKATGITSK